MKKLDRNSAKENLIFLFNQWNISMGIQAIGSWSRNLTDLQFRQESSIWKKIISKFNQRNLMSESNQWNINIGIQQMEN